MIALASKPNSPAWQTEGTSNANLEPNDTNEEITAKYERERAQLLEEYEENDQKL